VAAAIKYLKLLVVCGTAKKVLFEKNQSKLTIDMRYIIDNKPPPTPPITRLTVKNVDSRKSRVFQEVHKSLRPIALRTKRTYEKK
jgi:hypothetical protein